jgi:hypothetical protein
MDGFREVVEAGGLIYYGAKTAETLGLRVPRSLLLRADELTN